MDNARYSCITAAAGTCIGHNLWLIYIITLKLPVGFTITITFFTCTKLPDHTLVHCPEFPTAAKSKVVFIPYVTDYSLNSATDY